MISYQSTEEIMNFKKFQIILVVIIASLVLVACGSNDTNGNDGNDEEASKTINMGQINWAENIAVTNMWKAILEERGYDVKFHVIDIGTTMEALANDELDVGMEIWLPVQDASYLENFQDKVAFSDETWYDNAKVGLVVPEYMDIDSIDELNDNAELFENNIVGFEPGAGTMEVTEDLIVEYDLDYQLVPSSEPAMITEIRESIANEEPIVAPLWSPHSIFSELDLKYLDDPKEVYGGVEKIHHVTRLGFADDYPEVDTWFKNWKMDDDAIGSLMSAVGDAEDQAAAAAEWVEENEDLVAEWLDE